jgi:MFS family permease
MHLRNALGFITVSWMFGSVWMTATAGAPLAVFASGLGASPFQFGLLSALPFIASLISLPASVLIDATGHRKGIFLVSLYAQRALWFAIALAPLWMMERPGLAPWAMAVFLVLMFLMHCGQAVGGPAWVSWMADVVPERSRGKYFGRRRQWGIVTAVPVACIVGFLLDRMRPDPAGPVSSQAMWVCALVFIAAAVFGLIDIAMFQFVPHRRSKPAARGSLLQNLAKPLRDGQFLWFAGFVGTMIFAISFMGQFVTLYLIEKLRIANLETQVMLLVAPMVAQFVVLHAWGKAVDRMGKKPVLVLASLGLVPVGLGWCLMNSGMTWLGYLLSGLGAALWAGVEVANFNLVLEMSGSDDKKQGGSSYVAANGVIINVAGALGGLTSGVIATWLKDWSWDPRVLGLAPFTFYEVLFLLSGLLRLVAVGIFLPHLHEHGAKPAREALRFMTANIYNNLSSAALLPLRVFKLLPRETYRDIDPGSDASSMSPHREGR